MMVLEEKLDGIDIKEKIVDVLNSIVGEDCFCLNKLGDDYTHEVVRKKEYSEDL